MNKTKNTTPGKQRDAKRDMLQQRHNVMLETLMQLQQANEYIDSFFKMYHFERVPGQAVD